MLSMPELRTARTRAEFVERIGKAAAALERGAWLEGGNWDAEHWGGTLPTRDWIDSVTPNTPVAVVRLDQHMLLLNSLALRLAGIDRNTPDPEGGVIGRHPDGEPNGIVKDRAKELVQRVIPARTDADIDRGMKVGIAYALSKGVTQAHITELDWTTHHSLRRLRAAGAPGMRFYSLVPIEDWEQLAELVTREGRGDDWVRWGGLKGLVDGSLGSRTALFSEPYANDPGNRGIHRTPTDKLHAMIAGADAAGLHVAVHAIGDAANEEVLTIFDDVVRRNGPRDRRFRVEHVQHVHQKDIPRFAQQNVIASMQPYHAIDDGRWAVTPLGPSRLAGSWAFRSLLDADVRVTFGSDWPVAPIEPLAGVAGAVLRQTIDGANPDGWVPEQRIRVEEALTAYTATNAYAGFQDDRLGRIEPGFLADVVVLDTDLRRAPADRIAHAKVLRTIVGGVGRYADSAV
jgi:predicted amidohydrolase YtcJ